MNVSFPRRGYRIGWIDAEKKTNYFFKFITIIRFGCLLKQLVYFILHWFSVVYFRGFL